MIESHEPLARPLLLDLWDFYFAGLPEGVNRFDVMLEGDICLSHLLSAWSNSAV